MTVLALGAMAAALSAQRAGEISVTTFDISSRVNQHLESARRRAQSGQSYLLQLPLDMKDPAHDWSPDLVGYWRRFGDPPGQWRYVVLVWEAVSSARYCG